MVLVCWSLAKDWKVGYKDLNISYSLSDIQPRSFISCEKTYLSARMLRSEILILCGKRRIAQFIFWMRVKIAKTWKVNPHLVGSLQYLSSMLMFFQLRLCHSFTGYSIQHSSGISFCKSDKKVDFPQPMLPSIEQKPSFFGVQWSINLFQPQRTTHRLNLIDILISIWKQYPSTTVRCISLTIAQDQSSLEVTPGTSHLRRLAGFRFVCLATPPRFSATRLSSGSPGLPCDAIPGSSQGRTRAAIGLRCGYDWPRKIP